MSLFEHPFQTESLIKFPVFILLVPFLDQNRVHGLPFSPSKGEYAFWLAVLFYEVSNIADVAFLKVFKKMLKTPSKTNGSMNIFLNLSKDPLRDTPKHI